MPDQPAQPERIPQPGLRGRYWSWQIFTRIVLLTVIGVIAAVVIAVHFQPQWVIKQGLKRNHVAAQSTGTEWQTDGSLRIEKFSLGDYLRTDHIEIRFSWIGLLFHHRFRSVDIYGPQVWLSKVPKQGDLSAEFDQLRIFKGTLLLDSLGPHMPIIPIQIGDVAPVVFNNITFGNAKKSVDLNKEQTLTVDHISIHSPIDALAPVLDFAAINITFTWAGILNNEIIKLQILGPKVYLGPDLFWFVDEFKKQKNASRVMSAPWKIDLVQIQAGQLAISAMGQPGVTLPFYFTSEGQGTRVDQLADLPLSVKIIIPPQDRYYPDYKVELNQMRGEIGFALPLKEHNANNVVPTVYFDKVSWDQISVTQAWSSLTCDRTGLYGKMGGACYGGYLNGEFSVLFESEYPWKGTFTATRVGAKPVIEHLASKYMALDGLLDGKLEVHGKSKEIVQSAAVLTLARPGQLEIKSLDQLLAKIPADWSVTKKDLVQALVQSLKIYPYTTGDLKINYGLHDSAVTLSLRGQQGARTFDLLWHQAPGGASMMFGN
jgi:hypothetical protein